MHWDLINGLFELVGGMLVWLNVRRLLIDRQVKGVSWSAYTFFAGWGVWNLFYYPALHQWISFAGGILLVGASLTWSIVAVFIILNNKRKGGDDTKID